MGYLRSAAKRLARFTERHIPDPARRWGSALAHELDYIEGDWHSLAWALGGLRLLLLHGFVPTPTPARVHRQAVLHAKLRRQTMHRSLASRLLNRANMLISALLFLTFLHRLYPTHSVAISGIVVYCAGVLACLANGLPQRTVTVPDEDDTQGLLSLYQQDLRRSTSLTSMLRLNLPMVLIFAGMETLAPTFWVRALGLIWPLLILLSLQKYRANRLTLHAFDVGIDEPQP